MIASCKGCKYENKGNIICHSGFKHKKGIHSCYMFTKKYSTDETAHKKGCNCVECEEYRAYKQSERILNMLDEEY